MLLVYTTAVVILQETLFAIGSLDNLTECEKQRLEKLPNWQQYYTADEIEEKLTKLCNMAKAWDLTAKLNIPQLNDPSFDPMENPVKLNLLPQQRTYIESKAQCQDSASCFQSLTKRTLRVKVKSLGGNQTAKRKITKRQVPPIKVIRKEYRALTDKERQTFNRAIVALKNKIINGSYNAFDLHASLHSAAFSPQAHYSCGFIPFHRIYLLMLEKQLQEVSGDMTLGIPYWDSTLDVLLPRPCDSALFTDDMLGPSAGFVNSGPFANFRYPEGSLMRNCQGNRTIKTSDLMFFRAFKNYSQCCYCVSSTLELVHGLVHVFVNGVMNNLNRASFDPCFWLHHAFIDKLYEDTQVNFKVNPSNVNFRSPACLNKGIDGLDEPMLPFGSRDNKTGQIIGLKNRDGLLPRYTLEDYSYESSPSCADKTCTGKYLYCDAGVCKSRIRNNGLCDQQAADLYNKTGTNACLDGYKCQIAKDGQFNCSIMIAAQSAAISNYYYYYYY